MGELEREGLLSSEDEGESLDIEEDIADKPQDNQPGPAGSTDDSVADSSVLTRGLLSKCGVSERLLSKWPIVELKELLKLSIPTVMMMFFQQSMYIISILFAGHISQSSRDLDAAALANSFINVTGLSLVIGLSAAADTLCPQNFGFKNYKRVGVILQQGIIILSISILPVVALWLNSESFLLALQQPPCVARLSSFNMLVYTLALPPIIVYIMLQKYLQAQSVVWVFVATGIIQNLLTVVFNALFIFGFKMGIIAVSISMVLAMYISVIFLVLYIKWRGLHKLTWDGWSFESLRNWGLFMKLALPGFCMIAFEWWTFEISVLVSGSIDETQLGVNTILLQVGTICFMLPYGTGTAASVRVGNELGAGNPLRAKRASYTALGLQFIVGVCLVVSLGLSHDVLARLFTDNPEVIAESSRAIYPAMGVFFFDQIQGVLSGIFRGSGRQLLAASINFIVYYVIGLPLGICLALLAHLDTLGMWSGLAFANGLQACIFFVILLTTNWDKQAKRAIKNAGGGSPSVSSISQSEQEVESIGEVETGMSTPNDTKDDSLSHDLAAAMLMEEERNDPLQDTGMEDIPLVSYEDVEEPLASMTEEQSTLLEESKNMSTLSKQPRSKIRKEKAKLLLSRGVFLGIGLTLVVIGAVFAGVFRHEDLDVFCETEGVANSSCDLYCQNNSTYNFPSPSPTASVSGSTEYEIANRTSWQLMPTPSPALISCSCPFTYSPMVKPTPFYV